MVDPWARSSTILHQPSVLNVDDVLLLLLLLVLLTLLLPVLFPEQPLLLLSLPSQPFLFPLVAVPLGSPLLLLLLSLL